MTNVYHGTVSGLWNRSGGDGVLYVAVTPEEAASYAYEAAGSVWADHDWTEGEPVPRDGVPLLVTFDLDELRSFPGVELQPDWGWGELEDGMTWEDSAKAVGSFSVAGFRDDYKGAGEVKSLLGPEYTVEEWARFARPVTFLEMVHEHEMFEAFSRETTWLKQLLTQPTSDVPMWYVEGAWEAIGEWLDENAPEAVIGWLKREGVESASDLNPEYWWELPVGVRAAFIEEHGDDIQTELMRIDPAEAPSRMHMDFSRQIVKPVWLTHFSEDAESVASDGFQYGMADADRLGLTTYIDNKSIDKSEGGYNFAFVSDSRDAAWSAGKAASGRGGYGTDFVMFRNVGGIEVHHYGDEENQVIVWGASVDPRDMVLVMGTDDGGYCVQVHPYKGHGSVKCGLSYMDAVNWVKQNYDQYRKKITGW